MVRKSKSIIAVIGLGIVILAALAVWMLFLRSSQRTEFAQDGYILTAEADESSESGTVSSQLWFSGGASYTSSDGVISFVGAEGSALEASSDSFVHYEGGAVTTVTDCTVMDLDEFTTGVIAFYSMEPGDQLNLDGMVYYLGSADDGGLPPTASRISSRKTATAAICLARR